MGYLTSIIVTIDNGESIVKYKAETPGSTLPTKFDNNYAFIRNTAGERWVEILVDSSENNSPSNYDSIFYSSVLINDYFSKTTISISQYYFSSYRVSAYAYYTLSVRLLFTYSFIYYAILLF